MCFTNRYGPLGLPFKITQTPKFQRSFRPFLRCLDLLFFPTFAVFFNFLFSFCYSQNDLTVKMMFLFFC